MNKDGTLFHGQNSKINGGTFSITSSPDSEVKANGEGVYFGQVKFTFIGGSASTLGCNEETDFFKIIEVLSEACVSEFVITVNSFFNNIVNTINEDNMYSDYEFLIDEFLIEYPMTIQIKEDEFFIDFDLFKGYDFQLKRVVKRYTKNNEQETIRS